MLGTIAAFELVSRLKRSSTWVYCAVLFALAFLFMNAAGGAFSGATVTFGTSGKTLVNSPYALHQFTLLLAQIGLIVVAGIVGRAVYQDFEDDTYALFFVKPISKLEYLGGRFLGSLGVALVVYAGIGLGLLVGSWMPWLDRSRLGPTIGAAYLLPYLTCVVPNLLFGGTIFFALAALARRMLPIYVASVILVIGFMASRGLLRDLDSRTLAGLLDPFGGAAAAVLTQYWSTVERDTRLVGLHGIFLANRALWLGVALLVGAYTYRRFTFAHLGPTTRVRRGAKAAAAAQEGGARPKIGALPVPAQRWDLGAQLANFVELWRLQLRETVKSVYFVVILLAGALFVLGMSSTTDRLFGTRTWPVTYEVVELVHGNFALFTLILVTFFSGELVWRERDARVAQIVDAMPVPGWVTMGAKLAALLAMQVIVMVVVAACGVAIQLSRGYFHFEPLLYVKELFVIRLLDFWFLCVLAMVVHVVVNQKYVGHFVLIAYYVVSLALPALGIEHHLVDYGGAPDYKYSDMNGYGHFARPLFWFHLYWTAGAVALVLLAQLVWVRGVDTRLRARLSLARARLTPAVRSGLAVALLSFSAAGAFIFYNTNVLNAYRTARVRRHAAAEYERKYKATADQPQPRVTAVRMKVDLYPETRRADVRGELDVVNQSTQPIETIYATVPWPTRLRQLTVDAGVRGRSDDEAVGFHGVTLAAPLPPGAHTTVRFVVEQAAHGFTNGEDGVRVFGNGTFFDTDMLLQIGYRESRELSDDDERRREKLPPRRVARPLDDPVGRMRSALADWVTFDAEVSTTPDQLAVAPGNLVREWSENGRRHFHYRSTGKTVDFGAFLSARYTQVRDAWHDVAIEIDYQRGHEYNVKRMIEGIHKALDYCTTNFGPYQFQQVRILEFPRYASFAEAFAGTIPYSEAIGFIAEVDPKDPDDIDYPLYVTAHEVAHQWWGHQVTGADVEGAALPTESLAQYSALMVMKHEVGAAQMKRFLKYELDRYLRGRGEERHAERPLVRVAEQPYVYYQKGSLALYALQDAIGEDAVNRGLRKFVEQHRYEEAPYARSVDLVAALRAEAPARDQKLIGDLFEKIVLFENRALSATATPKGAEWEVRVAVAAKKLESDGNGREQEVPLDDWIDVGVLDAAGETLALERRHFAEAHQEATFTVAKRPARAGIDPLVKLIDRKWEDNTVKVELR